MTILNCWRRTVIYKDLTADELEFMLPLEIQKYVMKEPVCGRNCPLGKCGQTVTYEQIIWRSDNYSGGNSHRRIYDISYRERGSRTGGDGTLLFRTERHSSFREALIEMCELLDEAGIISPGKEALK